MQEVFKTEHEMEKEYKQGAVVKTESSLFPKNATKF